MSHEDIQIAPVSDFDLAFANDEDDDEEEEEEKSNIYAEKSRILIADDCSFNISALQCQLAHFNMKADVVRDGQMAF